MDAFSERDKLILASASPRRRELLRAAGIDFDMLAANVAESSDSGGNPAKLAENNAVLKASEVARRNPGRPVLGADTVVALGGVVYGKPIDVADAKKMLKILRGRTHSVFTGVALVRNVGGILRVASSSAESKVAFKNLSDSDIDEYISKVDVMDKAGSYAAQECGSMIIERIDGDFDNVMGLPMAIVKNLLDTELNRGHQ